MTFSDPIHETNLATGVCIVAPSGEPYQSAAKGLMATLAGAGCSDVEILRHDMDAMAGRHAIALGNMMDRAPPRPGTMRCVSLEPTKPNFRPACNCRITVPHSSMQTRQDEQTSTSRSRAGSSNSHVAWCATSRASVSRRDRVLFGNSSGLIPQRIPGG